MRRKWRFIVSFVAASVLPWIAPSALADDGAEVPFKLAWTRNTDEDGRQHVWDYVTYVSPEKRLMAVDKSFDVEPNQNGRFALCEFSDEGQLVRQTDIDQRDPAEPTTLVPGSVIGLFPLPGGQLLLVGKIDNNEDYSLLTLDENRNRVSSVPLPVEFRYCSFRRAVLATNGLILVGTCGGGKVVALSLDGSVLWSRSYRREVPSNMMWDVLLDPAGTGMFLLGMSGYVNKFGMGPSDVWLLRTQLDGEVQNERRIPGRDPRAAPQLIGNQLVVVYDKSAEFHPKYAAAVLTQTFETVCEVAVNSAQAPCILPTNGDRFVLSGVVKDTDQLVQLKEYDLTGSTKRSLDIPWKTQIDGSVRAIIGTENDTTIFLALTSSRRHASGSSIKTGAIYAIAFK